VQGCVGGYATNPASRDRDTTFSGSVSAVRVWSDPVATPDREPSVGDRMSLFREPDAGNLHVRFDEREQEPESSQTGLRRRGENPVNRHRETNATAPVLDSTRLHAQDLPSWGTLFLLR